MEIKSNIAGMANAENNYGLFKYRLNKSREDLVNIITDIDDYWSGRSGDSFKYICWYLKILIDYEWKLLNQRNIYMITTIIFQIRYKVRSI